MTEQANAPAVTPTNNIAVSLTCAALGTVGLVVAAMGWWDPGWVMGVGLLCAIALLFWQSVAFGRSEAQPAASAQVRRESVLVTVGMNGWVGGLFIWAIATDRHTETDGLLLAVTGLTCLAWGCWRLREARR